MKLYFRYNGRFHITPMSVQKTVCPLWHDYFTHFAIELTGTHLWVQINCKLERPFVCPIHDREISFRSVTTTHRLCYVTRFEFQTVIIRTRRFRSLCESFLPVGATVLGETWPPQQSVSFSLYLSSSPSTALSSLLTGLLPHHPSIHSSQTRSSFSSSYKQSSFHHLSWHRSHFHSLYMSHPSYSLTFYKYSKVLSVYDSIQFFIISNSPDIPLLDRPVDLPQYFPYENP